MKAVSNFIKEYIHWFVVGGVALLCALFIIFGHPSADGKYITLDSSDVQIPETTKKFIEDAEAAMYRIMNENAPTDEETIKEYENGIEEVGLGGQTINTVIGRRLSDGDTDGGKGWQCSKYTAYLATGKREYSYSHPDYGPVNGKDIAAWLVKNFGWKYSDPVEGAIGSGGFNTQYGHTAMYLYSTGSNTAMVNDANYVPLTVATHNMNIDGWVWVVPGDYTPPAPELATLRMSLVPGMLEAISKNLRYFEYGYYGKQLFGDNGAAQMVADDNGIKNRGLIFPGQVIIIKKERLGV